MQIKKKPIIAGICLVVVLLLGFIFFHKGNNPKVEYYYSFIGNDNLTTQTIKIYDKANDLKEKYYLYYDGKLISSTASQAASVPIVLCDLEKHPVIQIRFADEEEKHDVIYKKG